MVLSSKYRVRYGADYHRHPDCDYWILYDLLPPRILVLIYENRLLDDRLCLLLRELLPLVLHESLNDSVVLALVAGLRQLPGRLPLEVLDEGRYRLLLYQIPDVEVRVSLGDRCVVKEAVPVKVC